MGGTPPLRAFSARDTGARTMAWSAAQDRAGIMYFGCDSLLCFDGDRWRSAVMEPSSYGIRALDIGPNGRIWVGAVNEVGWFEPGARGPRAYHSLTSRLPPALAAVGDVWRVYAEGPDRAVFVTHDRILRWDSGTFASWDCPGMKLLSSMRTPKGIYIHYPPRGLLRMGAAGPELVAAASVLGTAEIRWIDDSRSDWTLVTTDGLKVLGRTGCAPLATDASAFLRLNTPTSVERLDGDSLVVGTLLGGIALVDAAGRLERVLDERGGLPENHVYSVFKDREGVVWAMGPTRITRLDLSADITAFAEKNGHPQGGCESITEHGGETYGVSHSSLLRISRAEGVDGPGHFEALGGSSSRFFSVLGTARGLVVGSYDGLRLWTPDGLQPLASTGEVVFRVAPSLARPGAVLASLQGRVLYVDLASGAATAGADGLPDYGDSLADETSGRLWAGTPSRGLFVSAPGSRRFEAAGLRHGPLPSSGSALVSRSGSTLLVLADESAYYLDPASDHFVRAMDFPSGGPAALCAGDAEGLYWAALEPVGGARSARLLRVQVGPSGVQWAAVPLEGLARLGSVTALHLQGSGRTASLWICGSESLLRAGPAALGLRPAVPAPSIRARIKPDAPIDGPVPFSNPGLHFEFSSLAFGMRESERYQTILAGVEPAWSSPSDAAERDLSGLREGAYDLRVRLVDDGGAAGPAADFRFEVSPPWWRTRFAYASAALAIALAVVLVLRLRGRALERRAAVLEEMVRERTVELEKANAAKTEFVASMSHEIRNPMGGIIGTALQLSETPLSPSQRELVSTLRNCASFLASLVDDVLDFAEIEAGAYRVSRGPVSPREVMDAVVRMLAPQARGIRLEAQVAPDMPPWILGDAARIQQVVVNFAANALKFGATTVRLTARRDGAQAVFSVEDDGAGISPAELKNLFVRFSRLKAARNSAIPGTGLGLAVCRALAERMGGRVGVESTLGRGSTFFLCIPLEEAAAKPPAAALNAAGRRALVVEDIDYNARSLGMMLTRMGFLVEFASDGREALSRLVAIPYSAAFLDRDLPGMEGVDIARTLRAIESGRRRTLLIATTAYSTARDRDTCLAAGMDGFVAKPITPEKLRAALEALGVDTPASADDPAPSLVQGIDLGMIRHLSDGTPAGMRRELAQFAASLDQAMGSLREAARARSRPALKAAAHRILSHARLVGAESLESAAADLQEFHAAYSDTEVDAEVARVVLQADRLKEALLGTEG